MASESGKPTSSSFAGDFGPGEVLIGRYRVVALVGEGGMGQVYLADDLVLGQPVAVKFLPAHVAEREGGLERFRDEVRHSREVTHPNVARVHDIGEVDGRHFLTMEFVDGEDLSSLVRRIGRLPREKAAEIGQQICAGLAEAHRKGVLHRDLKPANVMLDGEGRVRLTDFGLAVAVDADAPLAGTPQYMAPEQLSGVPASVQSEVYSLGLLLYELYTGRRALKGRTLDELRREHEEGGPAAPSTQLADIDEAVEAVLTRCLARDPAQRPGSVLEVARALPGGDPLATAMAEGQTPAPHVVAAARDDASLTPRRAATLATAAVLLLLGVVAARTWFQERAGLTFGKPSAVLRERAREMARELSGEEGFEYEVHWYTLDQELAAARATAAAGTPLPSPLIHHSRFGPVDIVSSGYTVTATDPAPVAGDAHLVLDASGALVQWSREAPARDADVPAPTGSELDWDALLEQTGIDPELLAPVEASRLPAVFADDRRAWRVGAPPSEGVDELRIEAASLRGRPVELQLLRGDTELGNFQAAGLRGPIAVFLMLVILVCVPLAWRNVRAGRADVRGSLAMGLFTLLTHVLLAFGEPLPTSASGLALTLFNNLSYSLHLGVRVALLYMALEPFARRRWPRSLISWNRLLEGRLRDPAVGRDVLIGLLAAPLAVGGTLALTRALIAAGLTPATGPVSFSFLGIEGPIQALAHVQHIAGDAVLFSGTFLFLLVMLRRLIPLPWVANVLWLAVLVSVFGRGDQLILSICSFGATLILAVRVGFLSIVAYIFGFLTLMTMALTVRPNDWTFPSSLVVFATFAFLVGWSYRAAVGERSLFETEQR